jgi:hypothetical protein
VRAAIVVGEQGAGGTDSRPVVAEVLR